MKFTLTAKQYVDSIMESVSKKYIFRLEHIDTHQGPYQTKLKDGSKFDLADKFPISPRENPAPIKDKRLVDNAGGLSELKHFIDNGIFAFESMQHLRKWFGSKAIRWMLDDISEFVIIKKSVPEDTIIYGDSQCIVDAKTWIKATAKTVKF